ncbi:MAG: rubrerythrin family protein [Bacteroidetes bacterium]|nr:MAG: rubrerythrin family protein [Bacteroidota bacterium]
MNILTQQRNEITEHVIYSRLAKLAKDPQNAATLQEIAAQELEHYHFWQKISGQELRPNGFKVWLHLLLARIFGLSFSLRLMEMGESEAGEFYDAVAKDYPEALKLKEEELEHEEKLIDILHDYRLVYAGSIVLGLNDALVEFTGTLAGLTLAFADNRIVGITGLIMGFAASLSMAASGYLSSREEEEKEELNPVTAAIYTGVSYILTVALLVLPYLLQNDPYLALASMLATTVVIIAGYTYYISVAKAISFKKRFFEMALISLGVAAVSFGIGMVVKQVFGIEV